ncbi:LLM class flavin-dependent oxidoreductase [Cohnella faecalis]|uniref:LLM class flavin-dependent oxidoreductase n=1 Tax=Cohnella faecalis TaxID=2315694 RepID=A0A398CW50_9BACL|nr:LLM class flavin-dependent oxidoreductase [Cohnella faecalis]RIE03244.1 LLM class flavin-dependent oxidoreductase [Cohnella faecalis]
MAYNPEEVEFGWYIPTYGDGRYIGVKPERESTLAYLTEVAQTAERAGFTFALIPTGGSCLDAWVVGSALVNATTTFKPLVAMRPGLISPVLAARMASTLDTLSGGRLLINVVTGSTASDLKVMGDPLAEEHDRRYDRTREFLEIVKSLWINGKAGQDEGYFTVQNPYQGIEPVRFHGDYYDIDAGISYPSSVQSPHPPLYFGGSSPAGKQVAAEQANVYLMWAEPVDWIKEQIADLERIGAQLKADKGIDRTLRYGIRAQILVRDTEEEAWQDAWNIISKTEEGAIEQSNRRFGKTDATNQKRQNELRDLSKKDNYILGPNLWAGLSTVRSGGSLLIVGTPDQVSDRILEYVDAGVSSFILSGFPHLEEADIAGRKLLPLVKSKLAARDAERIGEIETKTTEEIA